MTDASLDALLQTILNRLKQSCHRRDDPWRTPSLATVDDSGLPSVRTVVLRGYADNQLEFHTDTRSAKWQELKKLEQVGWCFWDPESKQQLRIQGNCTLHHQDKVTQSIWDALPGYTQTSYGTQRAPSTAIEAASEFEFIDDVTPAHFGVIRCSAHHMDWLELGRPKHPRAQFNWGTSWEGQWVVP